MQQRNFNAALIGFVIGSSAGTSMPVMVQAAQLPTPCIAGGCGAQGPATFVTSGAATAVAAGNTLTVNQSSDRAVLNWGSFNISAEGRVIFQQPRVTSIALNRIFQANPSQIFGELQANGQIYLVNPNGFVFGKTARVNAAGILASTLDLKDSTFNVGIVSPGLLQNDLPALESDGRVGVLDANGNPVLDASGNPVAIKLVVEEGASLSTTGSSGRILLASREIDNAGSLQSSDGQVLLAAGEKVYLQASSDPALRGLLVEVDTGGKAWNQLTGAIDAPRGNITLVGLAVNQEGRLSASTTVSANGSIRLLARDSHFFDVTEASGKLSATHTGTLDFGPQSITSVLPELSDSATAVDEQAQFGSSAFRTANPDSQVSIEGVGHQVTLAGGSVLRAPGGLVDISALFDPRANGENDSASQLRIDSGAVIDLAGSDATLPMSRNQVTVELRANELKDSPDQRNGALRGKPLVVDARIGTTLGDISGAIAAIPKSVAERTSSGGIARFNSDGDIVAAKDATLDVSGGVISYQSGVVQTSQLIGADGKLYDIGTADPTRTYVGALNPTVRVVDDRYGQISQVATPGIAKEEPGYVQGQSAGTLSFAAPNLLLSGTFLGNAVAGPYQRTTATAPRGGTFILGDPTGGPAALPVVDYRAPSIIFVNTASPIVVAAGAPFPGSQTLQLPLDYLRNGFTDTRLYSNGVIKIPEGTPLQLVDGSSFSATARRIDLLADIQNLGGSLVFSARDTAGIDGAGFATNEIILAPRVKLNVDGTWSNDFALDPSVRPITPLLLNGGTIDLSVAGLQGSLLSIGENTELRANGGAQLTRAGSTVPGRGGNIALRTDGAASRIDLGPGVDLSAFGVLGAKGGSLVLAVPALQVNAGDAWAPAQQYDPALADTFFVVGAGLFKNFGFSAFELSGGKPVDTSGTVDVVRIAQGTAIDVSTSFLRLDTNATSRASDGTVQTFSSAFLPPEDQRLAASVSLAARLSTALASTSAQAGNLTMQPGASLQADPGSKIAFSSVGSLLLDGSIRSAGGSITAGLANPPGDGDVGYLSEQHFELGPSALLDVSGAAVLTPNDRGLLTGKVLTGGAINLVSDRGSMQLDSGSLLNVSGASAALDLQAADASDSFERHQVSSSAGAILIRAPESLALDGDIRANAGIGDLGQAAAGSLAIQLTRDRGFGAASGVLDTFPITPRVVQVVDQTPTPSSMRAENGTAIVSQALLGATGADAISVLGGDEVSLQGGLTLSLARSVSIDAPLISVTDSSPFSITAPYVALGNSKQNATLVPAVRGASTLDVQADFIDLIGFSALGSVSQALLSSSGDIRLRGIDPGDQTSGGVFSVAGLLHLDAERVYATTDTSFRLQADGGLADRIEISQSGASSGIPLSAGSHITLAARDIVQGGTLLAPFGSIDLQASNSLTLADGSMTSVTGQGETVPYGRVQLGEWTYRNRTLTSIPSRQIVLQAPSINSASSAVIDVRGGGDLYASEFVPGTGGSKDALTPGVTPGLFAILPSLKGQYAPFDALEYTGSDLASGASIYLAGGGPVAAGVYPLLPARYALLPGAYLVNAVPSTTTVLPSETTFLNNSTPVVSGYLTFGNTDLGGNQFSGFAVRPGSYGRTLAEYDDSLASTFFADRAQRLELSRPNLPMDAGTLAFLAGTRLNSQGSVLTAAAANGVGASIDISASQISIVAGAIDAADPTVQISVDQLASWKPASLLIGGRRTSSSDGGNNIDVTADSVTVKNGAELSLDEVLISARERISVETGATLSSTRGQASTPSLPADSVPLTLSSADGSAASLLAVSDLAQRSVQRPAGSLMDGVIHVAAGATIATHGALTVDAPGGATLDGAVDATGARVTLAANQIAFGTGSMDGTLVIGTELESALQSASALTIAGARGIDVQRNATINLGSTPATRLELATPMLRTQMDVTATFGASTLALSGGDATPGLLAPGAGTLALTGEELEFGAGTMNIDGFGQSVWRASTQTLGKAGGNFRLSGDLDLSTPRIALDSSSDTLIDASSGLVRLLPLAASGAALSALQLGGSLTVVARDLEDSTNISAPSGLIALDAVNAASVLDGAVIDVGGRSVSAAGQQASSRGGTIRLDAGGELITAVNSTLILDGAGNSNAGQLRVSSGGAARLDGEMTAKSAASGGRFGLDAASVSDFSALNAQLEEGGFSAARRVHVGSGDLAIDAGQQAKAHDIELITDLGTVNVGGTISTDATGEGLGSVRLYGGSGVSLVSGSLVEANAFSGGTRAGRIDMGTTSGAIDIASGSTVAARGSSQNGTLTIRAPTIGNDIAISSLAGNTSGVALIDLSPILAFDVSSAPSAADLNTIRASVGSFVDASSAGILSRLASSSNSPLNILPGVELRTASDLSLDAIDLAAWRFNGQPVSLSVRVGGSVQLNGAISDGFTISNAGNSQNLDLSDGRSASISVTAGANLAGADPLGTLRSSVSDITFTGAGLLRSGTGHIALSAARDISFLGSGSDVYTGGMAGAPSVTVPGLGGRQSQALFPDDGGAISVKAGRDILGAAVTQSISEWQLRQGTSPDAAIPRPRFWSVNATQFGWNIGSLGGGDVTLDAGRDLVNVSAAAADSAIVGPGEALMRFGGGSLSVHAGRDVGSAMLFIAQGAAHIDAEGALSTTRTDSSTGAPLGTFLSSGEAQTLIEARRDVVLESVSNPSLLPQSRVPLNRSSAFFTYGETSALTVESVAGDVAMYSSASRLTDFVGQDTLTSGNQIAFSIYPSSLTARSYSHDLLFPDGTAYLYPSANARLDLFAARDIATNFSGRLLMSDGAVDAIPTVFRLQSAVSLTEIQKSASASRHVGDEEQAHITAGRDISGVTFDLAKFARISAGRDISDAPIGGQNLDPSDLTLISAGRDFEYSPGNTLGGISWGGPGRLDLLSARQVDFGVSRGVATTGRLANASIPFDDGASVTVMAGLGQQPDFASFISKIIAPSAQYQTQVIATVADATGENLPFEQALLRFAALGVDAQRPLVDKIFFQELVASGREANSGAGAGYERGYAAVDALFPGSRNQSGQEPSSKYEGNLDMAFSRIYTLAGGDISLFIPGGSLNVGLANPPPSLSSRPASELGIVAQGPGDVSIFTNGDVLVNQSRVFTLLGGNIAIWSTQGNIDAGRGAKSSLSAPPPTVVVDASGRVTLDFSGAVSGSGIRTIRTSDSVNPGDVDLIAPAGFVNAGDAGIGSAGNINIAAQQVVGLDNIQFGGAATGVPAEAAGLGASLAGVSSVASSTSNAASAAVTNKQDTEKLSPIAQSALSWLDVFVTGLGEENCKQDDLECLKRQKRVQ